MLSRRQFLLSGAALGLGGMGYRALRRDDAGIPGDLLGQPAHLGHRLREGGFPQVTETRRRAVVIVGGGIGGLSAAWWLRRRGFTDFTLLEMDREVGGNSRSGANAISAYPWGAHYVPLPGPEARLARALFEELGVIRSYDAAGRPRYEERYLCAEPQDRLLFRGTWQEGVVPHLGLGVRDKIQYDAFFGEMRRLKTARGRDGRPAFAIPLEGSSRDPAFLALDGKSMLDYLRENRWDSPLLRWYVDYCCRDDYGCSLEETSAWAGLHYFASRVGKAVHADGDTVLTWPEGNGWIVRRLRERAGEIRSQTLVTRVHREGREWLVDCFDAARGVSVRYRSRAVILAAPRFVAARLAPGLSAAGFTYAPWMVANVSLNGLPEGRGAPLSWDNVPYGAESLGYIVATHQGLAAFPKRTVLTVYFPLRDRAAALATPLAAWKARVLAELEGMHPGIGPMIARIDVWLWGHAMVRPVPGFLWGPARKDAARPRAGLFFAHSDASGLSLFEEAQYRGVAAARDALTRLGLDGGEMA